LEEEITPRLDDLFFVEDGLSRSEIPEMEELDGMRVKKAEVKKSVLPSGRTKPDPHLLYRLPWPEPLHLHHHRLHHHHHHLYHMVQITITNTNTPFV